MQTLVNITNSWLNNIKYIFNKQNIKNIILLFRNTIKVEWKSILYLFIILSPLMYWTSLSCDGLFSLFIDKTNDNINIFQLLTFPLGLAFYIYFIAWIKLSRNIQNQEILQNINPAVAWVSAINYSLSILISLVKCNNFIISLAQCFFIIIILVILNTKREKFNILGALYKSISIFVYNLPIIAIMSSLYLIFLLITKLLIYMANLLSLQNELSIFISIICSIAYLITLSIAITNVYVDQIKEIKDNFI